MAQTFDLEAHRRQVLARFPYQRVTASGAHALAEWERLRSSSVAVIIGDDENFFDVAEAAVGMLGDPEPPRTPQTILAAASALNHPKDLRARIQQEGWSDEDYGPPLGEWPEKAEAFDAPLLTLDLLTGRPLERANLVVLPTTEAAQAPAYLNWGGWNACPFPEFHVAALRSWRERYGAELVGISRDRLDLRVARRPGSRSEALDLAREQYEYCNDLVDQGYGDLSSLAASLMASDWWWFWWD